MRQAETSEEIDAVYRRCQDRYPTIRLAPGTFRMRVEQILTAAHESHPQGLDGSGDSSLFTACADCRALFRELHHEDLFLALACALGDGIAWELFASEYLALIKRFALNASRSYDASEDLSQDIVTLLLGGNAVPAPAPPGENGTTDGHAGGAGAASKGKLLTYNGRGSLAGWLRAAVAHAAVDRFRRSRREVSLDEMMQEGCFPASGCAAAESAVDDGPDARWGAVFSRALEEEITRLCPRDRLLLHLYYLQEVSLKSIGRQFGVHEATASRWLERVRRDLRRRVEQQLRKTHGFRSRDMKALWHWVSAAEETALESALKTSPEREQSLKRVQGGSL